jgi:hypothetical protein
MVLSHSLVIAFHAKFEVFRAFLLQIEIFWDLKLCHCTNTISFFDLKESYFLLLKSRQSKKYGRAKGQPTLKETTKHNSLENPSFRSILVSRLFKSVSSTAQFCVIELDDCE